MSPIDLGQIQERLRLEGRRASRYAFMVSKIRRVLWPFIRSYHFLALDWAHTAIGQQREWTRTAIEQQGEWTRTAIEQQRDWTRAAIEQQGEWTRTAIECSELASSDKLRAIRADVLAASRQTREVREIIKDMDSRVEQEAVLLQTLIERLDSVDAVSRGIEAHLTEIERRFDLTIAVGHAGGSHYDGSGESVRTGVASDRGAQPIAKESYSIEAEDLLIERVLNVVVGLPSGHAGRYLDIGAFRPVIDSNTYRFYQRGWRGICVEPNPDHCAEFEAKRPGDRVLNVGLASKTGVLPYHRFVNSGLNGIYRQALVDFHIRGGEEYLGHTNTECIGIREFLREHVRMPIDFMDIDIETVEVEVLEAWDWSSCRPTVICVEIHSLGIQGMLESKIGRILIGAGYSAMSRGWQSAIFITNEALEKFLQRDASRGIRELVMGEGVLSAVSSPIAVQIPT